MSRIKSPKKEKSKSRSKQKVIEGLPMIRRDAAGVDLGSQTHWACAPTAEGSERELMEFQSTTAGLLQMVGWLKERMVGTVALESTGVYWVPPFEVLEAAGFEVHLVNAHQLKQVPGRDKKSDPEDCQWIQRLHSCGLLAGSFRPPEEICKIRTLIRDKGNLVAASGDWVRRMQKSLDQMNVRVHRAVSDIGGVTGRAIIQAIVGGERDPRKLAELREPQCHKSEAEIVEQLTGHWRDDHLFSLQLSFRISKAFEEWTQEYDQEILKRLQAMERPELSDQKAPELKNREKGQKIRRHGEEEIRQACYRLSGVDLVSIEGVGVETVQVVLSEYGPDLSRFPNEKSFASHVTLVPHKPSSGGKPVKKKKRKGTSSRTAAALRMAATSQRNSNTALGALYRRIARRLGSDVAVFVTARRMAHLIYRALRWGKAYVDEGAEAYEQRFRDRRIKTLQAQAKEYGYQLVMPATT